MSTRTQGIVQGFVTICERVGAEPGDSDDYRFQKTLLVGVTIAVLPPGLIWGLIYLAFGEVVPASIPLSYVLVSSLCIILFGITHRYQLFLATEILLILLLPFFLMLTLGGFVNSSAVILWSLLAPFGALVFAGPRQATFWFGVYLALVAVSGLLEPNLRAGNNIPPALRLAFFVLNVGTVSLIAFSLLWVFVRQKNTALGLLRAEQQKSENLLLNILPKEIAAILKDGSRTIADHYGSASVLYADLVSFTPLTAELPPVEMVELLNQIFSHFDSLVEHYGVEKIRTIGDNYMVAAGVPRPRPDHAHVLARMALDMCVFIQNLPPHRGRRIDFRIGIGSGPLIAGVIGRRKFQYDLWGDTVNTASRMESQGEAGRIQITRETYELIRDEFVCEPRGRIAIKGKGDLETWYLLSARKQQEGARPL